jgi:tight adherence protein B
VNAVAWLALAVALLVLPVSEPVLVRARTLSADGRLAAERPTAVVVRRPPPDAVATAGCGLVALSVGLSAGPVLGAAALIATATVGRLIVVALRGRLTHRRALELLTALRLLAAELEAGGQPGAAFDAAAAACPEHASAFSAAAAAARGGHDPRLTAPALHGLAQAWSVAQATGAPLAATVIRVADDLAGEIDQRRAVGGAVAGAQSTAALLAGLPVLGLLLGAAMQAHPVAILLGARAGQVLCLVGVALDAAGVLWTLRLTSRAVRE